MNDRQLAILKFLVEKDRFPSATQLSYHLVNKKLINARRGCDGRYATCSIIRSLKDKVDWIPSSHDQWSTRLYFITDKGREALAAIK